MLFIGLQDHFRGVCLPALVGKALPLVNTLKGTSADFDNYIVCMPCGSRINLDDANRALRVGCRSVRGKGRRASLFG